MSDVTVVIPTYNSTAFISRTLESVFTQTQLPREIIVVDDASTDGTPELVSSIAATAPVPLTLIKQTSNSGGPAGPLNIGIARASTSLIATLDHDDVMLPRKLELQADCLAQDPNIGLVVSKYTTPQGERSPLKEFQALGYEAARAGSGSKYYRADRHDAYQALVCGQSVGSCSNFMFPKCAWGKCGGFDVRIVTCCDRRFVQTITQYFDFAIIDIALFAYLRPSDSLFGSASRLQRYHDVVTIYRAFENDRLTSNVREQLQIRTEDFLLSMARKFRNAGNYRQAYFCYWQSLCVKVWSFRAIVGMMKLLPHKLMCQERIRKESGSS